MKARLIPKDQVKSLVKKLSADYKVFVPTANETQSQFKEFADQEISLTEFQNTRVPPKEILFPKTEVLFSYKQSSEGGIALEEPAEEPGSQIIFGIRNCDARSFKLLDTFFASGDFKDTYYFKKRDKTTIVGLACNPPPYITCFCTSIGGDPFLGELLDAQLIDLEDKFILEAFTERGEKLINYMDEYKEASQSDLEKVKDLAKNARAMIKINVDLNNVEQKLDALFDSGIWDELSGRCLGCGGCSYLCPTCHCFDVLDEKDETGGKRIRFWDTCQFALFTLEGSGHNPRNIGKQRTRQRIMHKFNYYLKNYGFIGCVGCGRCIRICPVNVDITETLEQICSQ